MSKNRIGISAWGSISPLGTEPEAIWRAYLQAETCIRSLPDHPDLVAALYPEQSGLLEDIRGKDRHFSKVDRSVLLALIAAEQAVLRAGWKREEEAGVNIGSSRGATGLMEAYFSDFIQGGHQEVPALTSPTTTLGNIATWVAYRLGMQGPAISHSITCSSALHAVVNGVAWLESGRVRRFLAGGSEAPLTPFTIAQMKALRIYASSHSGPYPCRALDLDKQENGMVLGEGAACFCLELEPVRPLAWISGLGYAAEKMQTATGVSADGRCIQSAMRMALRESGLRTVDAIVCHTPGTRKGDQAEWEAIRAVFGENIPFLTTNKWKIGHTLGASGALSLEMGLLMLLKRQFIPVPYLPDQPLKTDKNIRNVLVNALGFGGNAVSVILSREEGKGV